MEKGTDDKKKAVQIPLAFYKPASTGEQDRARAYKETLRVTGNPRLAVRAYCAGNRWATENAMAVGNW